MRHRKINYFVAILSCCTLHCAPTFHAEQWQSTASKASTLAVDASKMLYCDRNVQSPAGVLATKSVGSEKLLEGFGGTAVSAESWLAHSTVLLTMVRQGRTNQKISMYVCTAMLIDRDMLLTAAHCAADTADETLIEIRAFFDSQPECNAENNIDYSAGTKVSQRMIHPNYEDVGYPFLSHEQYGDLALLKMEHDAPAAWSSVKLSAQSVNPQFNQLLSAGFGRSTPDPDETDPAGLILRFAYLNRISDSTALAQSNGINQNFREYLLNNNVASAERTLINQILISNNHFATGPDLDFLYVDQSEGKGICSGDSGGAAYYQVNGKYYVVGVASYVGNSVSEDGVCAGFAAYTQVLRYRSWIDANFNAMKKTTSALTTVFE